jgi:hypothetical protein
VADDFGPNGVYSNIPRLDSKGRPQLPMFMRWNPDPVGNDATNLAALNPDIQKVITQARADNPNLNFVIGNGKRSAADQDQAKAWGWSQVGSKDGGDANVHMQGSAVDLWGLDSNGHVQFDPDQQQQISQAMQAAAKKVGVGVNWGGNWKNFKDAPHFELAGGGTAASSGSPEGPPAQTPAPTQSTPGTTINSTAAQPQGSVFNTLRDNIAQFESGGDYHILGPVLRNGDQAIGKYQVMASNVPNWTQKWLGQSMTPAQFRADPQAQEAVFKGEFGSYLQNSSPADAASMWFTGKPLAQGANLHDVLGTSGAKYAAIATKGLGVDPTMPPPGALARPSTPTPAAPGPIDPSIIARGGTSPPIPGTTINGAPAVAAAPDANTPGVLPGFPGKAQSDAFTQGATGLDKALYGDQSGEEQQGRAAAFNFLPAHRLSPEIGSQIYGNTLTSMATPLQWSSAAPGQNPYANVGGQPIGGQFGTQLGSMQQLQQMMAMMGNPYGDAGYG